MPVQATNCMLQHFCFYQEQEQRYTVIAPSSVGAHTVFIVYLLTKARSIIPQGRSLADLARRWEWVTFKSVGREVVGSFRGSTAEEPSAATNVRSWRKNGPTQEDVLSVTIISHFILWKGPPYITLSVVHGTVLRIHDWCNTCGTNASIFPYPSHECSQPQVYESPWYAYTMLIQWWCKYM